MTTSNIDARVSFNDPSPRGIEIFEQMIDNMRDHPALTHPSERDSLYFPTSIKGTISEKFRLVGHIMCGLLSDDITERLEKARLFSLLLSTDSKTPIFLLKQFVQSNYICHLAEYLVNKDLPPELLHEVAFILSVVVPKSSENTNNKEGIYKYAQIFVNLLTHSDESVQRQAVRAFGKVVRDVPSSHDLLREIKALDYVLALVDRDADPSMLGTISMALFLFCREYSSPPMEQILPALRELIHSDDEEVLTKACWALSFLTGGTNKNKNIQAVIDADICRRLVEHLASPHFRVYNPALRTVGNITCGDDCQTQVVIQCGALPHLRSLFNSEYLPSINSLSCFAVSNITAGNKEQIESVIKAGLISPLVTLLQTAEYSTKEDAARAIFNITSKGTHDQIKYLVSQGCIKSLCDLLICPDPKILTFCLEGLENILKVGDSEKKLGNTGDVNIYAQQIDDAKGVGGSKSEERICKADLESDPNKNRP